ncbi:kinesin-like protein NACK2, partial [Tanacetum coccineum]
TVESKFVMRFSAIEIYNENIVDLNHVGPPRAPLRVNDDLDDPEKGTYVKELTEEVVKNAQHLREMIAACVGKRKVGETSLNNRSSRSHQILKLVITAIRCLSFIMLVIPYEENGKKSIESSPRDASGCVRSLFASLSLVDLAGSESAADTNVHGVRLREGGNINKSLLTLTRVINMLRLAVIFTSKSNK